MGPYCNLVVCSFAGQFLARERNIQLSKIAEDTTASGSIIDVGSRPRGLQVSTQEDKMPVLLRIEPPIILAKRVTLHLAASFCAAAVIAACTSSGFRHIV